MTQHLDGTVAIITGAARGTGEATARRFAEEGARVLVADVLDEQGGDVAAKLGEQAMYQHLDVTEPDDWAAAVEAVTAHFGDPGVLVNNAAILDVGSIAGMDPAVLTRLVAVNQIGPYLGIQAVIEPMKRLGGGSIVNVASIDAIEGSNGVAAYTSSKWGLRGLSKAAAVELGCHGIRVNTVCPGGGSSEMIAPFMEEAIERLSNLTERSAGSTHPTVQPPRRAAGLRERDRVARERRELLRVGYRPRGRRRLHRRQGRARRPLLLTPEDTGA